MSGGKLKEYYGLTIDEVKQFTELLTPKEQTVIQMRYGFGCYENPHSLQKIAEKYDVTRERIRQVEAKALRKIKRRKEIDDMNKIVNKTNMQWNLLSDDCLPPINKPVIFKDSRGSIVITRLKYIWEHESQPIYFGSPTTGTYWMRLPDIEIENSQKTLIERLLTPIENLALTRRSLNAMKAENISYVGDLVCNKWEVYLLKTPNFGRRSLHELKQALKDQGFNENEDCPEYFNERVKYSPAPNKELFEKVLR